VKLSTEEAYGPTATSHDLTLRVHDEVSKSTRFKISVAI
jgi:hypothetical protein